jgi:hypothetical protein
MGSRGVDCNINGGTSDLVSFFFNVDVDCSGTCSRPRDWEEGLLAVGRVSTRFPGFVDDVECPRLLLNVFSVFELGDSRKPYALK